MPLLKTYTDSNYLILYEDGGVFVLNDYKTQDRYGSQVYRLSLPLTKRLATSAQHDEFVYGHAGSIEKRALKPNKQSCYRKALMHHKKLFGSESTLVQLRRMAAADTISDDLYEAIMAAVAKHPLKGSLTQSIDSLSEASIPKELRKEFVEAKAASTKRAHSLGTSLVWYIKPYRSDSASSSSDTEKEQ